MNSPQDKPPREFWINDDINLQGAIGAMAYKVKEFCLGRKLRVIEYSAYEAMREANEFLRVDILKTVAMFQESEKDKWTARKENAELKEKLARAESLARGATEGMLCAAQDLANAHKENDALHTRIEKLREALTHYSDKTQFEDRGMGVTDESTAVSALTADDALEKKDDTLP